MSYRLISEEWRAARKPHHCIWCGESILVGEKYRYERSVFDGGMQSHKWHKECNEAAQKELANKGDSFDSDGTFSAYENPRPTVEA